MKIHYDRPHARELLALLGAIGREIEERTDALAQLESEIEELSGSSLRTETRENMLHGLIAEAASHRRGLRLAKKELEQLGCSVVGTAPLTFRIPGRVGDSAKSFVWRSGDPVLR